MGLDSKRISTGGSTDRLNNLPCNVIGQILSLLPLKEAAKTSVLSKKWEDKWLTIPHLVFDRHISESTTYRVLLLHKEPIVKFTIENATIKSQTALCDWFNFLSKHKIEELKISPLYSGPFPVMPRHLFSFYHLKHLSLRHVEVRVPLSIYNGFSNLISIDFDDVNIELEELQRLIDKCPKLESLTLVDYFEVTKSTLHIRNHNLKSFKFQGKVDFIYIYSNAHLEDISIRYGEVRPDIVTGTMLDYAIKFFGQLSMIKKLQVNCHFLNVLGVSVPWKLPASLSHLKHIQFQNMYYDTVDGFKSALCLIRSSSNLQTLVIADGDDFCWGFGEAVPVVQYLKEEQKSTIPVSSSLKEVYFDFIYGSPPEMEFIKLLLLGATKLRKVQIDEIYGVTVQKELSIVKELASFRRASSQAVISTGK